jgi:hypothetical protein
LIAVAAANRIAAMVAAATGQARRIFALRPKELSDERRSPGDRRRRARVIH